MVVEVRRQLHVVTVIGLPLAGKSSLVTHAASQFGVEPFKRFVGHRGFCGTQVACLLNLEEGDVLRAVSAARIAPVGSAGGVARLREDRVGWPSASFLRRGVARDTLGGRQMSLGATE